MQIGLSRHAVWVKKSQVNLAKNIPDSIAWMIKEKKPSSLSMMKRVS